MSRSSDEFTRQGVTGRTVTAILSSMESPADTSASSEPGTAERSAERLAELLTAVQAKNRAAFDVFYDATVQRMYSLALRITRQHELAEDVICDLYLQVWQRADSYSPERGKVIAWLCVLCRSRALDALRRRDTATGLATADLETLAEPGDSKGPPDFLEAVEVDSLIHAALNKLSPQQRQLLALAYFRGHSYRELATITGMPLGTVKTQIHRTMKKLKTLLVDGVDPSGESDE